ncbi:MAG: IPT/TIG domain-containing protein [Actinobacteria bacterium]|nr:IPT/TIG domain-containing protein [Actinomycetota bacterium]MBU1942572.1 IPT/TIG domain-containing protein [Actinomycetota bacterium]MBU2688752.1 IPT/TIG domain-containing protein [Actinomycetota bacterium]
MVRVCSFLMAILAICLLLSSGLCGNQPAFADDWVRIATGGIDGSYVPCYKAVQCMAINGSNLYVGTGDAAGNAGGSVWSYDGSSWQMVGSNGLGDQENWIVYSMSSFRSRLYAGTLNGTDGCQVLRYNGGTSWTQVNASGFGDDDNVNVMSMFVFNDALYAGVGNDPDGAQMWRYDGSVWTCVGSAGLNPWTIATHTVLSMAEYDGALYAGTDNPVAGADVWRYDGSSWTRSASGGFDDPTNGSVTSLATVAGELYAGTARGEIDGGCKVYCYDGDSWNNVGAAGQGFGDPSNTIAWSMTSYQDCLVVGTYNEDVGCEIWNYDPSMDEIKPVSEPSFDEQNDPQGPGRRQTVVVCSLLNYGPELYCSTHCADTGSSGEVRRYAGGTDWPLAAPLGLSAHNDTDAFGMAFFDGRLAVGTAAVASRGQVFMESASGQSWSRIAEPGFGSNLVSIIASACEYQGNLYVGAEKDYGGCQIWRYNGSSWAQVNQDGFGDIGNAEPVCMSVFDDRLHVGTWNGTGAQVWSYDGSTWNSVAEGPIHDDSSCVTQLVEFRGRLYASTPEGRVYRYDGGTSWTQMNVDHFGDPDNAGIYAMAVMGNALFAGAQNNDGCQVWSYDGTTWSKISEGGFGDAENDVAWSMAAFDSRLYVGTQNDDKGCGVFCYDGHEWTRAATYGFGSPGNRNARSMIANGESLFVGTSNWDSGCEVWRISVAPPVIDSMSPQSGPAGTTVTVKGSGFGDARGGSYVSFGGTKAVEYGEWTEGEVTCKVPTGVSGGCTVTVTTDHGTSNGKAFEVLTPTWYLPEGSTAWGFSAYVTAVNSNDCAVSVKFTYMTPGGAVDGGTFRVNPQSQLTVNPGDAVGSSDFSTKVECLEGRTIAVDRTMSWAEEAHNSVGVNYAADTWYLPEGCSAFGFETWTLIQNPNDAPANVKLTYMVEGGGANSFDKVVPAKSRHTFSMAADIGEQSASTTVTSDLPVIPERSMYRYDRMEGHDSVGSTAPAEDYYLAEGTTAWGFTTWVLMQNPNPTDAQVNVTYMTPGGPVNQDPLTLPANSRKSIKVNDVPGMAGVDCSIHVHGTVPILAERAMYWNNGEKEACHDSIGSPAPHASWYLPDGQSSEGRETYTLVANPNSTPVSVTVSYLTATGQGGVTFSETLPAHSRKTCDMSLWMKSSRASVAVNCARPIVVERSMYWGDRGFGTDTIGAYSD